MPFSYCFTPYARELLKRMAAQVSVLTGGPLEGGVDGSDDIYKMSASVRGYCALFLNKHFRNDRGQIVNTRNGSEADMTLLSQVLEQCHFELYKNQIIEDTPSDQLIPIIKDMVEQNKFELECHDAFVGVFSSHGNESVFIGSDIKETPIRDIIEVFNNKNCPQLRGKPKVFVFLCCRGDQQLEGVTGVQRSGVRRVNVDNEDEDELTMMPLYEDIIICYSTVLEFQSLRHKINGTFFGRILAENIGNHAKNKHLEQILHKCARDMSQTDIGDSKRLMSSWRAIGWRKMLYLNPGHMCD